MQSSTTCAVPASLPPCSSRTPNALGYTTERLRYCARCIVAGAEARQAGHQKNDFSRKVLRRAPGDFPGVHARSPSVFRCR